MTGLLALHGGGEYVKGDEAAMDALLAAAVEAAAHDGAGTVPRIVIVPTAAARQRPELAASHGERAFAAAATRARVSVEIGVAGILTRGDAADPRIVEPLASAHLVHLPGGDPDLIPATLRDSPAWAAHPAGLRRPRGDRRCERRGDGARRHAAGRRPGRSTASGSCRATRSCRMTGRAASIAGARALGDVRWLGAGGADARPRAARRRVDRRRPRPAHACSRPTAPRSRAPAPARRCGSTDRVRSSAAGPGRLSSGRGCPSLRPRLPVAPRTRHRLPQPRLVRRVPGPGARGAARVARAHGGAARPVPRPRARAAPRRGAPAGRGVPQGGSRRHRVRAQRDDRRLDRPRLAAVPARRRAPGQRPRVQRDAQRAAGGRGPRRREGRHRPDPVPDPRPLGGARGLPPGGRPRGRGSRS